MSLRHVITSLATGTYTVTRTAPGTYIQGRYLRSLPVVGIDAAADTLEVVGHGQITGAGPYQLATGSAPPGGSALAADYWLIVVSPDRVQLSEDAAASVALDLTDAGSGDLTLFRPPSIFSIIAVEEPFDGKLEDLPEGQHDDERRLIITETRLHGQRGGEPDEVEIDGESWRVERVDVCKSFGSIHYECVVARMKRGA